MMILIQGIVTLFFVMWIYSLFTCIEDKFEDDRVKSYWIIGHIVFPLTALAYLIFRNRYIRSL